MVCRETQKKSNGMWSVTTLRGWSRCLLGGQFLRFAYFMYSNALNTSISRRSGWRMQAPWPQMIPHRAGCKTSPTAEDCTGVYLQPTMRQGPSRTVAMGQHSLVACQCPTPISPQMWTWLLLCPQQSTWTQLQTLLSLILKLWMNPRRRNMQRRHGRARSQPLPCWSELEFVEWGWESRTPETVDVQYRLFKISVS